ncbi:MAG: NACHT domain-containing protein [Lysobacteraceae bacterium]|nr:MAG: NACHT domain-containing protein [Xanthomonadaceae bacterium]
MGSALSSSHRLVLTILGSALAAIALAYWFSGLLALLIALFLCIALWLVRPILMPAHHGATKVRILSLIGTFGIAGSYGFWSEFVNQTAKALISYPQVRAAAPWLATFKVTEEPSWIVLGFVVLVVALVNYGLRDRSIGGSHPKPIDEEFLEKTFAQQLQAFCSALDRHLVATDNEANWSPVYYANLDAEVEIHGGIGTPHSKRTADLQRAIRKDRDTQAFLVLGDPGSGKSVTLRKLALDMLKEVDKTQRVPIYVNLREWTKAGGEDARGWSESSKPTVQELEAFVVSNLKSRGDVFTEEFVDQYFRKLWQHGRLFFLLDSFDEIPALLDASEESWLIDSLSDVMSRFIATTPESRGILASRIFRRPTHAFMAGKTLEIRPMSEEKIIQALGRYSEFSQALKSQLFRERGDLLSIVRNPLLASLLGEWVKARRNLPENQADLYRDYLERRLEKCKQKMDEAKLSVADVMHGARDIAWHVFESPKYGLEAPVKALEDEIQNPNTGAIIDILRYARIARVGASEPRSFAFAHRRFLEYFAATRMLEASKDLPVGHIPTDSRGRDALVLYSQICDLDTAKRIAAGCWNEIQDSRGLPERQLRAVHCIRFLADAFSARRAATANFSGSLAGFIEKAIAEGSNLVHAKTCIESTGVLDESESIPILKSAMNSENLWLQETGLRACRNLPRIESELHGSILNHVLSMPWLKLYQSRRNLTFSLSLSDSFRQILNASRFRIANFRITLAALAVSALVEPYLFCFSVFASTILFLLRAASDARPKSIMRGSQTGDRRRQRHGSSILFSFLTFIQFIFLAPIAFAEKMEAYPLKNGFPMFSFENIDFMPAWGARAFIALLAVCMIDWLPIKSSLDRLIYVVKTSFRFAGFFWELLVLVVGLGFGAFLLGLISAFLSWTSDSGNSWLGALFAIGFLILLFGPTALSIFSGIASMTKDWVAYRKIRIPTKATRTEIVTAIDSLKSVHMQLRLVRQIAQQRTIATGEWPDGFSLKVTSDPVITELAKLDERWLGLDR